MPTGVFPGVSMSGEKILIWNEDMAWVFDQDFYDWVPVDPYEAILGGWVVGHKVIIWTEEAVYVYVQGDAEWYEWGFGPIEGIDMSGEKILIWNEDMAWVFDQDFYDWVPIDPYGSIIDGWVVGHKVIVWTEDEVYVYDQAAEEWFSSPW